MLMSVSAISMTAPQAMIETIDCPGLREAVDAETGSRDRREAIELWRKDARLPFQGDFD